MMILVSFNPSPNRIAAHPRPLGAIRGGLRPRGLHRSADARRMRGEGTLRRRLGRLDIQETSNRTLARPSWSARVASSGLLLLAAQTQRQTPHRRATASRAILIHNLIAVGIGVVVGFLPILF